MLVLIKSKCVDFPAINVYICENLSGNDGFEGKDQISFDIYNLKLQVCN